MEEWRNTYNSNLSVYARIISSSLDMEYCKKIQIEKALKKISFTLPKGLLKKEIHSSGTHPVVSQSKQEIIGYSERNELVIKDDLPLVIFGDHSKTIKFIDYPFIVGADGVKILNPIEFLNKRYFYYVVVGAITETKNYGRHFGLLKKKNIIIPEDIKLQREISSFLDDLEDNNLQKESYFDEIIELKILDLHRNSIRGLRLKTELTHQQTLLKKLRQQILQEAIEGKLTKDWRAENPDIEPASKLLKRIQAEKAQLIKGRKIKKQKPLPPIREDEKPFALPDGWVWCRLGDISEVKVGATPARENPEYWDGDVNWVSSGEVANNYVVSTKETITKKGMNESSAKVNPKGSVLVAMIGQGKTRGQTAILKIDAATNQNVAAIRLASEIIPEIIWYFFLSRYEATRSGASGGNQPALNGIKIKSTVFALPSMQEAMEIIKRLRRTEQFLNQLESQITSNQSHAEQLMQAVLKEAFR